jgi:molybdopterin-guanine dinucleotide biosynthesis protein A
MALVTRHASPVTGIILAGGRGSRMGSVDKGLKLLRGKPMVQWVADRFAPQVSEVLVNANQNIDKYHVLGYKIIPDAIGGFAGPLAGLHRGLSEATHDLVATTPCDSPFLPLDLIARLRAAMDKAGAELTVAKTGDQPHPVFCLCRRTVLPGLTEFLSGGGRKIDAWYSKLKIVEVLFDDQPDAFSNINTEEELQAFERAAPHG